MLELQVLTMNLWGLPWPVARDRRDRKRRFLEHMLQFPYDLVGIQELWWPWRRSLRRAPLVLPRSRRDSGLVLAGRLPLHGAARVEPFRDHAGPDRLKRKGLLRAVVAPHPEVRLCTVVTHLQAGRRRCSERFDRVYLRGGDGVRLVPLEAEVLRVGPRPLSDHHPLRVRLAIRDRE